MNLKVTSVGPDGDIGSRYVARLLTVGHRFETAQAAASRQGPGHQSTADVTLAKTENHITPGCIVKPPIGPLTASKAAASRSINPMNTSTLLKTWRGRTHMNSLRSDIDMSAEFAYGTTEDSSIEVAISGNSESGFAASGSVHLGHNRGIYATAHIVSRDHRSVLGDFTYGKYRVKQMIGCGWRYYYEIRAIRWQGNLVKSGKGSYSGCPRGYSHPHYSRGETVHVWHGTDYRYKADVTLPPVTLSGSHGYSKSADSYYTFGASGGATYHHFELCFKAKYIDDATVIYPKSWK